MLLFMVFMLEETVSRSERVRDAIMIPLAPALAYAYAMCSPMPFPAPVMSTMKGVGRETVLGSVEGVMEVWIGDVKVHPQ